MREKGNLAGKLVCSATKTLYNAGKSKPERLSIPLRGMAARVNKGA
jgi:hypothetical protein